MQQMIAHHAQALTMAALLATRTARADMRLLGERIDVSQKDEIRLMRAWLEKNHQMVPAAAYFDHPSDSVAANSMSATDMANMAEMAHALMPGMLTAAQLDQLAKAKGPEFDRLFLEDMIRHHEGALVMVHDLFATNGAAQDPLIFQFASDVDADQRAEILRMRALLAAGASSGVMH
jgi:uncharacterized protein (DUF305 family)